MYESLHGGPFGLVRGARGWVAGWQACGCSSALGCIAVAAPWPMGTQPPLATQALNTIKSYLMQLTTRSYGLGCFWHSLVARWSSVALCMTMFAFVAFTIVREHGGRFLSSGMSLWRMRRPRAYVVFALYSKLCQRGMAWRSSSVAFLLVPLPPSAFFLMYLFSYLFFQELVHFISTGLLASV